jgi:hypothetical protein
MAHDVLCYAPWLLRRRWRMTKAKHMLSAWLGSSRSWEGVMQPQQQEQQRKVARAAQALLPANWKAAAASRSDAKAASQGSGSGQSKRQQQQQERRQLVKGCQEAGRGSRSSRQGGKLAVVVVVQGV